MSSVEDSVSRVRAMRDEQARRDALKQQYEACKRSLVESFGWSEDDIRELQEVLKIDLAAGPGVERPFPMSLEERRECWLKWFGSYCFVRKTTFSKSCQDA